MSLVVALLRMRRRRLTVCPVLEGEEQLRLLNYQHNSIRQIAHLSSLKRLIFLDLYDNQIEEIGGLNSLRSLRVLMLGKNRCVQCAQSSLLFFFAIKISMCFVGVASLSLQAITVN